MKLWIPAEDLKRAQFDPEATLRVFASVTDRAARPPTVAIEMPSRGFDRIDVSTSSAMNWSSNDSGHRTFEWTRPGSQVPMTLVVLQEVARWSSAGSAVTGSGDVIACDPSDLYALDTDPNRRYFVSMVDGRRSAALAGPFADHLMALLCVDRARSLAEEMSPAAAFYTFGTASLRPEDVGTIKGGLNDRMGLDEAKRQAASGIAAAVEACTQYGFGALEGGRLLFRRDGLGCQ